jgi:hypothetical protein
LSERALAEEDEVPAGNGVMHWQRVIGSVVSVLLAGCASGQTPSDVPALVGTIVWATAIHPEDCTPQRCQVTYQLELRNKTGADVAVSSCDLVDRGGPIAAIPVSEGFPIIVKASGTQLIRASFQLPVPPQRLRELRGARLRCQQDLADEE